MHCLWKDRKHWLKWRKCWLPAFSFSHKVSKSFLPVSCYNLRYVVKDCFPHVNCGRLYLHFPNAKLLSLQTINFKFNKKYSKQGRKRTKAIPLFLTMFSNYLYSKKYSYPACIPSTVCIRKSGPYFTANKQKNTRTPEIRSLVFNIYDKSKYNEN